MITPYRSLRRLAPFALLLGLAACSSEVAATIDAGTVIGDAPRSDLPSTTDIPSTDVSSVDIPSTDVSSTDVSRTDVPLSDACRRPDIQTLPTRIDCSPRSDGGTCPLGYACLSLSGVVLQQFCGRACAADCDCPTDERCGSYTDKAGMHSLCVTANPGG